MNDSALKMWRKRAGLSQREAAKCLNLSLKGYQELERGRKFDTGEPVEPDLRTRLACAAIESGLPPI